MDKSDIIDRLRLLDTPCIADADSAVRTLNFPIISINKPIKLAGVVRTIHSNEGILSVLKGIEEAEEGEVLVIDSCGTNRALFGELMTLEARRKKLGGFVTDGYCRDVEGILRSSFPVFARGTNPCVASKTKIGSQQIHIKLQNHHIFPGDYILGDSDGLVLINAGDIESVLAKAEKIQRIEEKIQKRIEEGASFSGMLNTDEHIRKIQKGEMDSTLKFELNQA